MYRVVRPLLFRLDPERAHTVAVGALAATSRSPSALRLLRRAYAVHDPRLAVEAFGLRFPNPLGLAAGMDKDGVAVPAFAAFGFGFVEVGSVTAQPQPGNPKPRMFRLPTDAALINRMGFNNAGAAALAERIARWRADAPLAVPLGINVGKSKRAPLEGARADYEVSLRAVWDRADYLVVNVSSPNTPGLRTLQQREPLARLLGLVGELRDELGHRPALIKLSPDLAGAALLEIVELAHTHGIDGLIATNTTVGRTGLKRDPGELGGLSGAPLARRSLEVLRLLRGATDLPLVAVGGIATAADAVARLEAGATLLQVYTALVYRGPGVVGEILRGVSAELERRGATSVAELAR